MPFMQCVRRMLMRILPLIVIISVCPVSYADLPPRHEANRLLIALEESVIHQDWQRANALLVRMEALQTTLPVAYYYFSGQVNFQLQQPKRARTQLEEYVVRSEGAGQYYQQALKLITQIEQQNESSQEAVDGTERLLPGSPVVSDLKKLYLTDKDRDALVLHINALLTSNAYQGSRIKRQAQSSGVEYVVGTTGDQLTITEKKFDEKGGARLTVDKLDVFGVNPILTYDCDYSRFQCWIYHPQNSYQIWLMLDRNRQAAKEIADTLGRLIRVLQKGAATARPK